MSVPKREAYYLFLMTNNNGGTSTSVFLTIVNKEQKRVLQSCSRVRQQARQNINVPHNVKYLQARQNEMFTSSG